ncbi:hypothetical protein ACFPH8_10530 [Bizionia hallyeonensis]|uniref:Uncharacterized protein n=1 Tax=Bizionia hallyeonensis TaxID=1123757 RepID=A0ABW0C7S1_9FLAO
MKKLYVLLLMLAFNMAFYSCTPTSVADETNSQATDCCGNEADIPPPPPPPPPGDDD